MPGELARGKSVLLQVSLVEVKPMLHCGFQLELCRNGDIAAHLRFIVFEGKILQKRSFHRSWQKPDENLKVSRGGDRIGGGDLSKIGMGTYFPLNIFEAKRTGS